MYAGRVEILHSVVIDDHVIGIGEVIYVSPSPWDSNLYYFHSVGKSDINSYSVTPELLRNLYNTGHIKPIDYV